MLFKHETNCKTKYNLSPTNLQSFIKIQQVSAELQHFEVGILITLRLKYGRCAFEKQIKIYSQCHNNICMRYINHNIFNVLYDDLTHFELALSLLLH